MRDATTPELNREPRSAERAALEIAVKALRTINAVASPNPNRTMVDGVLRDLGWITDGARRALAEIEALVPSLGRE